MRGHLQGVLLHIRSATAQELEQQRTGHYEESSGPPAETSARHIRDQAWQIVFNMSSNLTRWDHDDNYEADEERHARLVREEREREEFEEMEQSRRLKAKQDERDAVRRRLHAAQQAYERDWKEQYIIKRKEQIVEQDCDEKQAPTVSIEQIPWVPTAREADMMEVMAMKERSEAASARLSRQCETTWKPLPPSDNLERSAEHNWFSEKVRRYVAINKRQEVRCTKCGVPYPEGDRAVLCHVCKTKRFPDSVEPEAAPADLDVNVEAEEVPPQKSGARAKPKPLSEKRICIVVAGPRGGGKTALVTTFCTGKFSSFKSIPNDQRWNFTPMGGMQKSDDINKCWTERIIDGTLFCISIIETRGVTALQRVMAETHVDGVLVVFSAVDESSFDSLTIYSKATSRLGKVPLVLVASKSDLHPSGTTVSSEDICDFADGWGCDGLEKFIPRDKEQTEGSRTIAMVCFASAKDVSSTNAVFDKVAQCAVADPSEWPRTCSDSPSKDSGCAVQ